MLNIDVLETYLDNANPELKEIIGIVIEAMNDWPNNVSDLDDFLSELKKTFGDNLSEDSLKAHLIPNYSMSNSWEVESLASLIKLFSKKDFKDLEEAFKTISDHLKP
jgi:hypothetical protein